MIGDLHMVLNKILGAEVFILEYFGCCVVVCVAHSARYIKSPFPAKETLADLDVIQLSLFQWLTVIPT